METKIHFRKSEEFRSIAKKVFHEEKEKVLAVIPRADIQHVGGTAIPGALTLGDLDIIVRVIREDFGLAVTKLKSRYHINHPNLWSDFLAIFHKKDHPEMPISIMVTVVDSPSDNYTKVRDRLSGNLKLLREYNEFKERFEGKPLDEYRAAKQLFFGIDGRRFVEAKSNSK